MRAHRLPVVALAAAAVYGVSRLAASATPKSMAFDVYNYYVPNLVYAVARLHDGGTGLLWNRFGNCGQPFFGISSTGILYPANAAFLFLSPGHALEAVMAFDFAVAGIGAFFLCRELGCGRAASLCGALAFQFGNATIDLMTWGPQMGGPYVWLPASMLFTERLVRAPRWRDAVALGATLALALLPGFPQAVLFNYQLIALRVAWVLVTRESARPVVGSAAVAGGLVLAPLFAAVALFPGVEQARLSVRNGPLSLEEMNQAVSLSLDFLRKQVSGRWEIFNPILLVPWVIAFPALLRPARARATLFYLCAGLVYADLALGMDGALFPWYRTLPLGAIFREPARFVWMPAFCLTVLAGLGADALLWPKPRAAGVVLRLALAGVGLWLFLLLSPLGAPEKILIGAIAGGTIAAALGWRRLGAGAVVLAVFVDVVVLPHAPFRRLLADPDVLGTHADLFATLRGRMSPQDRVYVVPDDRSAALGQKTPALFGVPSLHDYEPQPSRRYAEFFVRMRGGRPMQSLNDFYYPLAYGAPGFNRGMLALAGVRYVVTDTTPVNVSGIVSPADHPVARDATARAYEIGERTPRAVWVPGIAVVPNSQLLLERLAQRPADAARRPLVEAAPRSGFVGQDLVAAPREVTFERDDPEHVRLRVRAPARGFVLVSDQESPGWHATVDGSPAEIVRANYLFRVVEVPAGESVVEFRYAPRSVPVGAAVSLFAIGGVGAALYRARRTPRRAIEPAARAA